jgi:uncharacterized protein (DUF58 family)
VRARERAELLPSPGVAFEPDFLARAGRLAALVSAARERREGAGRAAFLGGGVEFVGFRPYRPGEDVRAIDWALLARLGKPYVRVARREASERWAVLLDTSASMGVGRPGKLQRAAEVAAALATIALRARFELDLHLSGMGASFRVRRARDLAPLLAFLAGARAEGRAGLGALAGEGALFRRAGSLFWLGDLFDLEPARLLGAVRRGQSAYLVQILAQEELVPPAGSIDWVDAESGERLPVEAAPAVRAAYEAGLERRIEAWSAAATARRAFHGCWSAAVPFERIVRATLAGGFD